MGRVLRLARSPEAFLGFYAGGQAEIFYAAGRWASEDRCLASSADCQATLFSVSTRRVGGRCLGTVALVGALGGMSVSIAAFVGPELAAGALDFEGLATEAAVERYLALQGSGAVGGPTLVGGLGISLGISP